MARPTVTFQSVQAAAEACTDGARYDRDGQPKRWTLGVQSPEAKRMAITGWEDDLDRTLDLVADAVTWARQEITTATWSQRWDVSGDSVDVGRYVSGEPECMRDYVRRRRPRSERVITVCASVSVSGSVSADALRRRGETLSAFVLAVAEMGYATEIWADLSLGGGGRGDREGSFRVLVKSATERLDPAVLLFALAHPAMLRKVMFGAWESLPNHAAMGDEEMWSTNIPIPAEQDLAEGTIYLPELCSDRDVPDAHTGLEALLREAGLVD